LSFDSKYVGGAADWRPLFDSASSIAANYRSASRGRSKAEFVAKLGIVVDEADETEFRLTFATAAGLGDTEVCNALRAEAKELTAIFAASQITAKYGRRQV
jgi:four helix bundle protein